MILNTTVPSNYLAKVVVLGLPKQHPNADRLQIWDIDGQDVITDMSRKPGDICIFFPAECQINHRILRTLNLYSSADLNQDLMTTGYISRSRRVKATKIRGVISEGMLLLAEDVLSENISKDLIGTKFDTVDGVVICNKYIPEGQSEQNDPKFSKNKSSAKVSKLNQIVPGQFAFHYDTNKIQDNLWIFTQDNKPLLENQIVITDKWHGTSAVFSNLLVKKELTFLQKIGNFLGMNIPTKEYRKLYSSRSVIKYIEGLHKNPHSGHYDVDVWGKVFEEIKHVLMPEMSIYGEIVGYVGDTKMVQKGYDYGCNPGEHKFVVYRITSTDSSGVVTEWSWSEIKDFCKEHNLEVVPELFSGTIKEWYIQNKIDLDASFLNALKSMYLEKKCKFCRSKVPAEGICIRAESFDKKAYKLKSKAFLLQETLELDAEAN